MKRGHLYFFIPVVAAGLVWTLTQDVGAAAFIFLAFLIPAFLRVYIPYIQDNPNHLWFKRKLYGWGWTPATWQGWLVTLGYVGLVVALALAAEENAPLPEIALSFFLPAIVLTIALIWIAYAKGEKPRWQWGPPKNNNNNG